MRTRTKGTYMSYSLLLSWFYLPGCTWWDNVMFRQHMTCWVVIRYIYIHIYIYTCFCILSTLWWHILWPLCIIYWVSALLWIMVALGTELWYHYLQYTILVFVHYLCSICIDVVVYNIHLLDSPTSHIIQCIIRFYWTGSRGVLLSTEITLSTVIDTNQGHS